MKNSKYESVLTKPFFVKEFILRKKLARFPFNCLNKMLFQGLYYSYYKTMAEAPSILSGLHDIVRCNITEYPTKVNVLRRFNLYPEVITTRFT